jgi:CrcB protein
LAGAKLPHTRVSRTNQTTVGGVPENPGRIAEPAQRQPARRRRPAVGGPSWDVLGVVALGGMIGALGRYGIAVAWPTPAATFPWATFVTNVVGCALIGALMVLISDVWTPHRLIRPFAGTGILGGFTTFSTYSVDVERLLASSAARTGLALLVAMPAAAIVATWSTAVLVRGVVRRSRA